MAAQIKKPVGLGRDAAGSGMTSQRTRARMVERLREQGIRDERVLGAMAAVPRHLFVEEALASRAYEDTALPIGFGQTISQPYVVARMIEFLIANEKSPGKALEVGTGCGYQAAVLAQIFREVYSIERIKGLHERARANLLGQRLTNLRLVHGDGHAGLEKAAPFQGIIIAAAARAVPEALERQIAPGGKMILPLRGSSPGAQRRDAQRQGAQQQDAQGQDAQRLVLIERSGRGLIESELDPVRFVPLEAGKA
jgi:protein-L-isoaspartate(D-aspartate) O-methyltransferase